MTEGKLLVWFVASGFAPVVEPSVRKLTVCVTFSDAVPQLDTVLVLQYSNRSRFTRLKQR